MKLTDLLLLSDIFALITLRLLGGLEDLRRGTFVKKKRVEEES